VYGSQGAFPLAGVRLRPCEAEEAQGVAADSRVGEEILVRRGTASWKLASNS